MRSERKWEAKPSIPDEDQRPNGSDAGKQTSPATVPGTPRQETNKQPGRSERPAEQTEKGRCVEMLGLQPRWCLSQKRRPRTLLGDLTLNETDTTEYTPESRELTRERLRSQTSALKVVEKDLARGKKPIQPVADVTDLRRAREDVAGPRPFRLRRPGAPLGKLLFLRDKEMDVATLAAGPSSFKSRQSGGTLEGTIISSRRGARCCHTENG